MIYEYYITESSDIKASNKDNKDSAGSAENCMKTDIYMVHSLYTLRAPLHSCWNYRPDNLN
jgi:hypothetical protein